MALFDRLSVMRECGQRAQVWQVPCSRSEGCERVIHLSGRYLGLGYSHSKQKICFAVCRFACSILQRGYKIACAHHLLAAIGISQNSCEGSRQLIDKGLQESLSANPKCL